MESANKKMESVKTHNVIDLTSEILFSKQRRTFFCFVFLSGDNIPDKIQSRAVSERLFSWVV